MSKSLKMQLGAASGILDVLLSVLGVLLLSDPPAVGASGKDIATYYATAGNTGLVSGFLSMLAILFFIWFMRYLSMVLEGVEGDKGALSGLVFGAAIAAAGVFLVASAIGQTLPILAKAGGDPTLIQEVSNLYNIGLTVSGIPVLLLVGVASLVTLQTGVVAHWLGYFGLVVAALLLVTSFSLLFSAGDLAPGGTFPGWV